MVEKVTAMVNSIVQVDVFDRLGAEQQEGEEFVRPALRHTKFAHAVPVATSSTVVEPATMAVAV